MVYRPETVRETKQDSMVGARNYSRNNIFLQAAKMIASHHVHLLWGKFEGKTRQPNHVFIYTATTCKITFFLFATAVRFQSSGSNHGGANARALHGTLTTYSASTKHKTIIYTTPFASPNTVQENKTLRRKPNLSPHPGPRLRIFSFSTHPP